METCINYSLTIRNGENINYGLTIRNGDTCKHQFRYTQMVTFVNTTASLYPNSDICQQYSFTTPRQRHL